MSRPLEWCTTEARRLRHLSDNLAPGHRAGDWYSRPAGRGGRTICGQYGQDEERANWVLAKWSNRTLRVAGLRECRSCLRAAAAYNRPLPDEPDPSAVGGEPEATSKDSSDLGGDSA